MVDRPINSFPFVETTRNLRKHKVSCLLVETTNTTSQAGAAYGHAITWHRNIETALPPHLIVDERVTLQTQWDSYQTPKVEKGILSTMLCAEFTEDVRDWSDPSTAAAFENLVKLVAIKCYTHKIQTRDMTEVDLDRWRRWRSKRRGGLIFDVVGVFPKEDFIDQVNVEIAKLKESHG